MKSTGIPGVKAAKRWFSSFLAPCAAFFRGSIVPVFLLFALTSFEVGQKAAIASDTGTPNYQVVANGVGGQAVVPGFQWAMDEGQKGQEESLQGYFLPGSAAPGAPLPIFLHSELSTLVFSGAFPASFLRRLLFPFHSFL